MSGHRQAPPEPVGRSKPAVLVFSKAPVPGKVKTRLAAAVGEKTAATIQKRLTRQALDTALAADLGPVCLYCAPDTRHRFFRRMRQDTGVRLRSQRGADLGERMRHAMASWLSPPRAVIVIGSDCPAMGAAYLRQAAAILISGDTPVVLGPARDGGYVLIGASRLDARLFSGVPWGTGRVLEATRERLRALGWRWRELAPLDDLDRPGDLLRTDPALRR